MKIINPKIEVEKYDGKKIMKNIERACRTCYRSENLITEDSYKRLLTNCLNRGHESVLEHEKITVRMVCDVGCYDDKTMVLTTNGWKYIKDVDVCSDKVYTLNENNEVVKSSIQAKISKPYNGKMLNFKSTQIDLCVTPDHNMWVFDVNKRSKKTKTWKFIEAKNMTTKSYEFSKMGNKKYIYGETLEYIPEIKTPNKFFDKVYIKNSNAFFELMGWFITDGSIEVVKNYKRIRISQLKKENRERIKFLLNELGLEYFVSDTAFSIRNTPLAYFVHNNFYKNKGTSKSLTMFVPDFVRNASSNEIEAFLMGVIGGNGYIKKSGTIIITSTSEQFCKDIIELCFKVGKTANYYIHPNLNKYKCSFKQNHTVYDISIVQTEITWWNKNDNNFRILDYNGIVHCLILEKYHKLFVMRNGKAVWCGNCYKDLTRHRFGSFSIESSRYCAYNKDKFDNEIKFIKPVFYKESWTNKNYEGSEMDIDEQKSKIWYDTMEDIEDNYMNMAKLGCTPDEMRMILPHSTAAEVTMTANIREWRHILDLRTKKMAHPSVRQILIPLLLKFKADMPELFGDIEYDTEFPKEWYAEISDMED